MTAPSFVSSGDCSESCGQFEINWGFAGFGKYAVRVLRDGREVHLLAGENLGELQGAARLWVVERLR